MRNVARLQSRLVGTVVTALSLGVMVYGSQALGQDQTHPINSDKPAATTQEENLRGYILNVSTNLLLQAVVCVRDNAYKFRHTASTQEIAGSYPAFFYGTNRPNGSRFDVNAFFQSEYEKARQQHNQEGMSAVVAARVFVDDLNVINSVGDLWNFNRDIYEYGPKDLDLTAFLSEQRETAVNAAREFLKTPTDVGRGETKTLIDAIVKLTRTFERGRKYVSTTVNEISPDEYFALYVRLRLSPPDTGGIAIQRAIDYLGILPAKKPRTVELNRIVPTSNSVKASGATQGKIVVAEQTAGREERLRKGAEDLVKSLFIQALNLMTSNAEDSGLMIYHSQSPKYYSRLFYGTDLSKAECFHVNWFFGIEYEKAKQQHNQEGMSAVVAARVLIDDADIVNSVGDLWDETRNRNKFGQPGPILPGSPRYERTLADVAKFLNTPMDVGKGKSEPLIDSIVRAAQIFEGDRKERGMQADAYFSNYIERDFGYSTMTRHAQAVIRSMHIIPMKRLLTNPDFSHLE